MDPAKPTLLYDADCGFCRGWVARWRRATGGRVEYLPFQAAGERFPQIARESLAESIHLIEPGGEVTRGARAVFGALAHARLGGAWLWAYRQVPGFAAVSEWTYRRVARNRGAIGRAVRLLWGPQETAPGHVLVRWTFLRLLGLVYLAAFASLWVQVDGLIGSRGILPAAEYLDLAREQVGAGAWRQVPSLCWLNPSDAFLRALCGGGTVLSLLLVFGVAQVPVLVLLWTAYLSLVTVGRDFLWFQWDSLLLETGFLAIFLAPTTLFSRPTREAEPSLAVVWLLRWLLFRLMFFSGVVKLASGDPVWADGSALQYHYYTQPLPPWTAWWAHQLPAWFQHACVGVMFAIELAAPFLIFAPRRVRMLAFAPLVLLQLLILATGNYCFFNWLTLALCVLLLDDGFLPRRARERWQPADDARAGRWRWGLHLPACVLALVVSAATARLQMSSDAWLPPGVQPLVEWCAPFRLSGHYGLFAVMTTTRPEIVVEGSADGETWKPYVFRYKPGDPKRAPGFVAPYHPRLDWQMWFAALGSWRQNEWFVAFCVRLLEGSPEVLALLESNPFPDHPPKYVRGVLYDYTFTTPAEREADGSWWKARELGPYYPVLSLKGK